MAKMYCHICNITANLSKVPHGMHTITFIILSLWDMKISQVPPKNTTTVTAQTAHINSDLLYWTHDLIWNDAIQDDSIHVTVQQVEQDLLAGNNTINNSACKEANLW